MFFEAWRSEHPAAGGALCSGSLADHRGHRLILTPRPASGKGKAGTSRCVERERGFQDKACDFYSLGCKSSSL
ncbi:hypothetical protein ACP70R_042940 [Stipagrostis hirtigluma subsp. patula]